MPSRSRFQVRAKLDQIAEVRRRLGDFCDKRVDERTLSEITLAVDEAATNIVRHGYTPGDDDQVDDDQVIDVEFEATDTTIIVRLWDDGIAREESDCVGLPPGVAGEGGMGLNLMRAMLTSLEYSRSGDRNLLTMSRDTTPTRAREAEDE